MYRIYAIAAAAVMGGGVAAHAQDTTITSGVRPEIAFAIGAAFPQGNFNRDVDAGLDGYIRLSYPVKPSNGLSLVAMGGGTDFKAQNKGSIIDTSGTVTSASQDLDYRAAQAYLGFQWTGAWESMRLRPRVAVSGGANFIETKSEVTVDGLRIDSLTQTTEETRFGLRFQLGSDWVLRNNIGLTIEFKLDHVFNVVQYEVSDGTEPVSTEQKSVAYVSILAGLVFPL